MIVLDSITFYPYSPGEHMENPPLPSFQTPRVEIDTYDTESKEFKGYCIALTTEEIAVVLDVAKKIRDKYLLEGRSFEFY